MLHDCKIATASNLITANPCRWVLTSRWGLCQSCQNPEISVTTVVCFVPGFVPEPVITGPHSKWCCTSRSSRKMLDWVNRKRMAHNCVISSLPLRLSDRSESLTAVSANLSLTPCRFISQARTTQVTQQLKEQQHVELIRCCFYIISLWLLI